MVFQKRQQEQTTTKHNYQNSLTYNMQKGGFVLLVLHLLVQTTATVSVKTGRNRFVSSHTVDEDWTVRRRVQTASSSSKSSSSSSSKSKGSGSSKRSGSSKSSSSSSGSKSSKGKGSGSSKSSKGKGSGSSKSSKGKGGKGSSSSSSDSSVSGDEVVQEEIVAGARSAALPVVVSGAGLFMVSGAMFLVVKRRRKPLASREG